MGHPGNKAAWVGILGNVFLFSIKLAVGLRIGALSVISDALHSVSDALTSVILLIGLWASQLPPDEKHPYGHGRAEAITSVVISMLLLFIAYDIAEHSLLNLLAGGNPVKYDGLAFLIILFSIAFKYGMGLYAHRVGKACGSHAVVADAWHHYSDALSSGGVVVVILFGELVPLLDPVVSLIIVSLIAYVGIRLIRDALDVVLGKSDVELERQVRDIAEKMGAANVHSINVHDYGRRKDVTLHVYFHEGTTVERAHALSQKIEEEISRITSGNVTVHFDYEGGMREEIEEYLRKNGMDVEVTHLYVDRDGIAVVLRGRDVERAAAALRERGIRCYMPVE